MDSPNQLAIDVEVKTGFFGSACEKTLQLHQGKLGTVAALRQCPCIQHREKTKVT
jgi:hypothetical protein